MLSRPRLCPAQALVEFALVLPLVVLLSLGVMQLVLYAHARDVVISSAQEGARLAAEEGRTLDDGWTRAQALLSAGLGTSLDGVQLSGGVDADVVQVRIDAALRPIIPLVTTLPMHAEARVSLERFRPGGGP